MTRKPPAETAIEGEKYCDGGSYCTCNLCLIYGRFINGKWLPPAPERRNNND